MTELSSFHQGPHVAFSSAHEMKLDDPITTEYCHPINTKGWDCDGVHTALIYQLVTEVKAFGNRPQINERGGGKSQESDTRNRMKQD